MAQTLQNQIMMSKSMNGLIVLSDGAGTTIQDGNIVTNNMTGSTITTGSLSTNDINLTGSLEIPAVNDITDLSGNVVSLYNRGKTTLQQDAFYYGAVTNNYNIANKLYIDTALSGISSTYVTLATTQTVTGQKNMTNLYPTFSLNTSNYKMGNAMAYQTSSTTDCIAWGDGALAGNSAQPTWGTTFRNICIGKNAGNKLYRDSNNAATPDDDNVMIGVGAGRNAFYWTRQNVLIGTNAGGQNQIRDCVFIGYNTAGNGSFNLTDSVIIGSKSGQNVSSVGQLTCVGGSNGYLANQFTIVGYNNMTNSVTGNRICILGSNNLQNLSGADAFSCAIGNDNGNSQTGANSYYNCYIGFGCNVANNTVQNSFTCGVSSTIPRKNCFYIGSQNVFDASGNAFQNLCLANKNTLFCTTDVTTGTTYTINWEDGDTINITNLSITSIQLPTPSTAGNGQYNIGAKFTIIRNYTVTPSTITINAPSGQTILLPDGTTGSSYSFISTEKYVTFMCVANSGTSFFVCNSSVYRYLYLTPDSNNYVQIWNTFTSSSILKTNHLNQSYAFGIGALQNENPAGGGANNNAFGYSSLSSLTNGTSNSAFGYNTLSTGTGATFLNNTAVGSNALWKTTSGNNTAIGNNAGVNCTTGANNTFIGASTDFPSTTQYSNSTCIGYNSRITANNQISFGTSAETSVFNGLATITGQYVHQASPTLITAATTLSSPYYETYSVNNGATAFTITIPTITSTNVGISFLFRRISTATTTTVISFGVAGGTQLIYNLTNGGGTNVLAAMASGVYIVRLVAVQQSTGVYAYYMC